MMRSSTTTGDDQRFTAPPAGFAITPSGQIFSPVWRSMACSTPPGPPMYTVSFVTYGVWLM